jgi:hypothetical protein
VVELFSRPSIEELKSDWCKGDFTVIASLYEEAEIYAMPATELKKSLKYIELLQHASTYQEAQDLYERYRIDPDAPRLTPALFSLNSNIELMDQRVQQEFRERNIWDIKRWDISFDDFLTTGGFADLRLEFECSLSSLWEEVKELPFDLSTDPCYNADEVPRFLTQSNLWTDLWIPLEIANEIGTPDNGIGLDYEPSEYIYTDLDTFVAVFTKHGFNVVIDDKQIDYIGWEWTHNQK